MSGHATDPPVGGASYYLGICDVCRRVETFNSQDARDNWEQTHEHEETE